MKEMPNAVSSSLKLYIPVLLAAFLGGSVPWWLQMYLKHPTLPVSAGTWYGKLRRTQERIVDWNISFSRDVSGDLKEGEIVCIYFDGEEPSKKGVFVVDKITENDATLVCREAIALPFNAFSAPLPGSEYLVRLTPHTDGDFQLKFYQGRDMAYAFSDDWCTMTRGKSVTPK